jgi:DNA recombination protein RmuC
MPSQALIVAQAFRDNISVWWLALIGLLVGFALGIAVAFVLRLIQSKTARELAGQIFEESEAKRKESIEAVMADMKASFGSLSLDALSQSTGEFLKLAEVRLGSEREIAGRDLEAKKGLIEEQLKIMTSELENLRQLVKELEKDRIEKFGELTSHLKSARDQTAALTQTTNTLREALASTKARGQWGERMAEDVLRLAGFVEDVNYLKQKSVGGVGTRPDFTFLLPRHLKLNMDVKFPLDNYMRFLEADSETERSRYRNDFLRDVKARVKEVTTREYINREQNTVDYVLLFIPNEQIYAFIHEQDSSILDDSIKNRVVLCSPLTLFAVLAIIRQAVDNFALEETSNEILSLMGAFRKQWDAFLRKMDRLGKLIGDVQREYESLITTRRRQLERPLNQLDEIRTERQVASSTDPGEEPLPRADAP